MAFTELGLSEPLLRGIAELGFEIPTPVQEKAIPVLLEQDHDLTVLAQTGTGKTAAFGLPILDKVDSSQKTPQALILCPTRELCMQITRDLKRFAKYLEDIRILAVYGGSSIDRQIRALIKGIQVVAATPGRMNDLLKRRVIDLSKVKYVVLDEADEMLNMGFKDELEGILQNVPEDSQRLLFSATMPKSVAAIAGNYMTDPEEITVGKRNSGAENVSHEYYIVHARDRYLALKRIADYYPGMYSIVFCRTRKETQDVARKLIEDGYNADSLHGDLSQGQRDRVMESFRAKSLQLLVATDVAARGLDVNDLTHVINYNLPDDAESYTHRSGRTGRAGKEGVSISIIHMREKYRIQKIQKAIRKELIKKDIPSGTEVCEAQLYHLIDRVKSVKVDSDQIGEYLPGIYETLGEMSREELIQHFVSLEFNRFLQYYRGARCLNDRSADSRREKQGRRERSRDEQGRGRRNAGGHDSGAEAGDAPRDYSQDTPRAARPDRRDGQRAGDRNSTRFYLNLGQKEDLTPDALQGFLSEVTGGKNIRVKNVEIKRTFSFFDVPKDDAETVFNAVDGMHVDNRRVIIEEVSERKPDRRNSDRRDKDRRLPGGGFAKKKPYKGKKGDSSRRKGPRREDSGRSRSPRRSRPPKK